MKTTRYRWIAVQLAGFLVMTAHAVEAQDSASPLMAGLEQPFHQPVLHPVSHDAFASSSTGVPVSRIQQQSHAVYSELPAVTLNHTNQNCGQMPCTDSHVCAESCMENKPWWHRKTHRLNRKCYFNYHSYHPKALHPIVHPACQPGYGYYETCWRKIAPNPCFCRPEFDPTVSNEALPTEGRNGNRPLEGEPLPPAPAYDR